MTSERIRDRVNHDQDLLSDAQSLNTIQMGDAETARQTLMDRFNTRESIIQPPEDTESLGEAIEAELNKIK